MTPDLNDAIRHQDLPALKAWLATQAPSGTFTLAKRQALKSAIQWKCLAAFQLLLEHSGNLRGSAELGSRQAMQFLFGQGYVPLLGLAAMEGDEKRESRIIPWNGGRASQFFGRKTGGRSNVQGLILSGRA